MVVGEVSVWWGWLTVTPYHLGSRGVRLGLAQGLYPVVCRVSPKGDQAVKDVGRWREGLFLRGAAVLIHVDGDLCRDRG